MACEQSASAGRVESLRRAAQRGFTLVEMAIVLVIIGLIIGGILKGQEIVDNARVKSQVSQIDSVKAAVLTFYDQYGFWPGDDPQAGTQLGASTLLSGLAGDGDGFVAQSGSSAAILDNAAPGNEQNWAWLDLQLARLIEGVQIPSTPTTTTPFYNAGKLANSYIWFGDFSNTAGGVTITNKMIRIQGNASLTGVPVAGARTADAAQIDIKYDDGLPLTGTIVEGSYSSTTNCCAGSTCSVTSTGYGLSSTGSPSSPYCGIEWLLE